LQLLAAAELLESDLWQQYTELADGNRAYRKALENLDSDMPQSISDNTNDELSHAAFPQAVEINCQPAIPLSGDDTPPEMDQPIPPRTRQQRRMQAIANAAGFHFATIEQGGSSLYTALSQKVSDLEVLRVVVSIGGTEVKPPRDLGQQRRERGQPAACRRQGTRELLAAEAVDAPTADGFFNGQSPAFFSTLLGMAPRADAAMRRWAIR
jgi:hypothetical protein